MRILVRKTIFCLCPIWCLDKAKARIGIAHKQHNNYGKLRFAQRNKTRIEKFNQIVLSKDIERISFGLLSGKMGICICFYHQARLTQNKAY